MIRAFVVTLIVSVSVLVGCGGEAPEPIEEQPASAYSEYFGAWGGAVGGSTSRRTFVSTSLAMTLSGAGDTAMISVSCGAGSFDIPAYQQGKTSVYFASNTATCTVSTPCGDVSARVGGITLIPTHGDQVAVQVSLGVTDCDATREEVVLASGVMSRPPPY